MSPKPRIQLEQWNAFIAVVEEGSFARAAEVLNKSQSAISYAVAKLEEQLPQPVLIQQGRKAVLSEAGEVLYRRAKLLLNLAHEIEETAACLAEGWESEITIAVDAVTPIEPVLKAMHRFGEEAPQTRIVLLETSLSGTEDALLERRADIALTPHVPLGFLATPVTEVYKMAVAHPEHALARATEPLTKQALRQSRQIVVRDSGARRSFDRGWLDSEQRFTVSHFSTSLKAVEAGLGFAFLPLALIENALAQGRLQRLNLAYEAAQIIPIYLIIASPDQAGPAVNAYARALKLSFKAMKIS